MTKDQTFMIDYILSEMIQMLIEKKQMTFPEALDLLYSSQLFEMLQDVSTGLYLQSPCYNYESLEHELKFGKIA